ncbi:MAG TPA: autotransporter outer membrane beta-barrel domain-containing protein, partial [Pseudoxanthomonas sp.]|nr:autotransporter outer membrane beta-barrel domain-containing protein [Pseudoxanthomonas sp.]
TQVRVNNVGGAGAQTVEGIKLIDVAGGSNGSFSLVGDYVFQGEQAVVAGAYAYRLYKNGVSTPSDGDWYLRSALTDDGGPGPGPNPEPPPPLYQAGVPVYEAYAGALQAFNAVGTLHQRTGNRAWSGPQAESSAPGEGLWVHAEGMDGRYRPEVTTSGTTYDLSAWKVEVGVDAVLAESANGVLTGGVGMHYGRLTSDASSIYGDGRIEIDGHGLAASMTWYGVNNVYVDGQARVALYQADLYSRSLDQPLATGNDGQGYVLGVETGRRIVLGERWSLTPQAQLTYARTEFSNFQDAFGVPVSMEKDRSVMGRVGLAADYRNTWQGSAGAGSSRVYGVANLYREFADGTSVDVSGTALATRNEKLWGGLGLGGAVDWAGGRFSIYGEVLAKTGLDDFGDSHTLNGTLGFRMHW